MQYPSVLFSLPHVNAISCIKLNYKINTFVYSIKLSFTFFLVFYAFSNVFLFLNILNKSTSKYDKDFLYFLLKRTEQILNTSTSLNYGNELSCFILLHSEERWNFFGKIDKK